MSALRKIRKILIANRGEIAVRIMRSCSEMGIQTVAVFSEPDRAALHVRMADEAYEIGPAPSSESYLVIDRIIQTALDCGADAIHPGYGFLSENPAFSQACLDSGLIFIGPDPETISQMGDKTAARAMMQKANVPMAPGTIGPVASIEEGLEESEQIGYPVLIKAAAGGGGKGMRIVYKKDDFSSAFESSRGEALSAFGDDRVFIEKYIVEPRHIEFQIMADKYGNIVHLFERECSIQRRHQKVIEEAPSVVLTEDVRTEMGEASIEAARSCSYVGAGTVEFLLDADHNFYFMEMNTRLQVEHPVTEWITGIDMVAAQIRIAEGQKLPWSQDDILRNGHSIECRVYAEDPLTDFLPNPGKLLRHRAPDGFGVRVDAGVEEGDEVSIHYDPMISKLSTWGSSRTEAISRMIRALNEYDIAGVPTTISFCRMTMEHHLFQSGNFSTHFVNDHFNPDEMVEKQFSSVLEEALSHVAATMFDAPSNGQTSSSNNGTAESVDSSGVMPQAFSLWRKNRSRKR